MTPLAQEAARGTLQSLQDGLTRAVAARAAAAQRVDALMGEVASVEARLTLVDAEQRRQAGRLLVARERVKRVAVARYVATPVAPLNDVLEAGDFTEMTRRVTMLGVVSKSDGRRIAEHEAAQREASAQLQDLIGSLERARAALAASTAALQQADADLSAKKAQLDGAEAGIKLVAGGFLFPVAGNHSFTDTFGAPRMFGTAYAHLHEGTDIFTASGTPLVAAERGVLIGVGVAVLGGNKLWLVGESGTRYFYAHLSAFGPGAADGKVVEGGEVVGYVGNTGNARTTPAHLHFEVHPGGGPAVNPYPLLQMIADAQCKLAPSASPGSRAAR
ncbi:MAG TPA: peptidoglycan DD-metalloendopeptidase family protein [Acidimicrobiales bacterium]|nr:peptidoglycan DD-metalloendopeptidase family protein [Acidimicrobiales bacterium]